MLTPAANLKDNSRHAAFEAWRVKNKRALSSGHGLACCCRFCEPVQALIGGFSPEARKHRWMLMFQAYLDDSGRASGPTYVIAGFLHESEKWLLFSSLWGEMLQKFDLPYFKMKEAMNPRAGEKKNNIFYGWRRGDIDELMALLTKFICDTLPMRIRITVPNYEYERIFKNKIAPTIDFPYLLAHMSAMQESTRLLSRTTLRERVDFVFDTASEAEQLHVIKFWHFWKEHDQIKERWPMYGDPPIFRDDKVMLPLQAADLYAWHVRKAGEFLTEGKTYDYPGWKALSKIPGAERDWTVADLTKMLSNTALIRDLNNFGPWPYEKRLRQPRRKR